jgi:hypothetical protein
VISGLTNGTNYTFTATATNAAGTSSASASSSAVAPRYIYIAPTTPTISGFSTRQVSVDGGQLSITGAYLDKVTGVTLQGKTLVIVT